MSHNQVLERATTTPGTLSLGNSVHATVNELQTSRGSALDRPQEPGLYSLHYSLFYFHSWAPESS